MREEGGNLAPGGKSGAPGVICNREGACSRLWIGFPLEALLIANDGFTDVPYRPLPWVAVGTWPS